MVLAPVLAFLSVLGTPIIIGVLIMREVGAPAILALVTAGCLQVRGRRARWFTASAALTSSEIGRALVAGKPIAENTRLFPDHPHNAGNRHRPTPKAAGMR
jgi:hypothetical protein